MTIHGSCLCGGVRFEFEQVMGPFEICHCNRCRKLSGSQGMSGLTVRSADYRMTDGKDLVSTFAAPVLYEAPAYHSLFCSRCGSPVPLPDPDGDSLEIPAGLLDDDPGMVPDKHIFVEFIPKWDRIADDLPQYSIGDLILERHGRELPEDFHLRSHYDTKDERKR
jgi:hypothetical protein